MRNCVVFYSRQNASAFASFLFSNGFNSPSVEDQSLTTSFGEDVLVWADEYKSTLSRAFDDFLLDQG